MTKAKGKADIMSQVKGAIQSSPDQIAEALWAIVYAFIGEAVGGSVHDFAKLAGAAAAAKREQIAKFIYSIINGAFISATIGLGSQIGLLEAMPHMKVPKGGMWFRVIIPVNWIMPWMEFIQWACPQTGGTWDIMKLIDPYPVLNKRGTTVEEYFIFWPGKGGLTTVAQAQEYAPAELEYAHGRAPAAIIASVLDLAEQLASHGFPYKDVGVVTGSECGDREVVHAWRYEYGARNADVKPVALDFHDDYVFVFSRKPLVP